MRTFKNIFDQIISFQNLLKAAKLAQRAKRFKPATARFNFLLENELWKIHYELKNKRHQPGSYYNFKIYEPKERVISAAPYKDRVIHHAIHNVLEPVFDPTFIHDSYATRKGKGTHAALDQFQKFSRRTKFTLKCDIKKYFQNIDQEILFKLIQKKIKCRDTLWLVKKIIDFGANLEASQPASQNYRGLPIGNLTSQFFANIYLNGFDHFVKEKLKCRCYVRYLDDFVISHDDKEFLWTVKKEIEEYLVNLSLELHENKCRVFSNETGVPFLGMLIFPNQRRIRRNNLIRFKRRLRGFQKKYRSGKIDWQHINQSIQSWLGYANHADSFKIRELVLKDLVF